VKIILSTLKKILFWSYERGSWQYDVMCVLILAFIFLSPNRMFQSQDTSKPLTVRGDERGDERGKVDAIDSEVIKSSPRNKDANAITIRRIEKSEDSSGQGTYKARRKNI
jgi:hypothetical protein